MEDLVRVEPLELGVTAVVFNRAARRNALSIALLEQLCERLEHLAASPLQRVAILRGDGPVFSAGLDLKEAADEVLTVRSAGCVERAVRLVQETPLVTIAAVHGGAYAGGAGIMAACDIVVAAENARIGFPEARRGLLPALIYRVMKAKVRDGDLRDLFLAGDAIDATRALQIGLVQRVVPEEQLMEESLAVANSVLQGGPQTIRLTKQMLNASGTDESQSPLLETHLQARHSAEAREGLAAFLEKRLPNWVESPANWK